MIKLPQFIATKIFNWWLRNSVSKAQKNANRTGQKYLVLIVNGKPEVLSIQSIRHMIKEHLFPKGFTAQTAIKKAVYIAYPLKKQ